MIKNPHPRPHLPDEVLNEYLDQALDGLAYAAAEAHLAACGQCAARLGELRAVFVNLGALPDQPLEHDLAPGVMAAVRRQPRVPLGRAQPARLQASRGRPMGSMAIVGALQVLAALVLLAFAWPFVAAFWATLPAPAFPPMTAQLASAVQRIVALMSDARALATVTQGLLQATAGQYLSPGMPSLEPGVVGLGLIGAGVVWLLGNALLLGGRLRSNLRRNS
jgi:anti-sigma factor RsiW